jgi:hypothetical protein
MDELFSFTSDNFKEFTDLNIYFLELNFNFNWNGEKKRLYDLFIYLTKRGHTQAASDLWDNMIIRDYKINPS